MVVPSPHIDATRVNADVQLLATRRDLLFLVLSHAKSPARNRATEVLDVPTNTAEPPATPRPESQESALLDDLMSRSNHYTTAIGLRHPLARSAP